MDYQAAHDIPNQEDESASDEAACHLRRGSIAESVIYSEILSMLKSTQENSNYLNHNEALDEVKNDFPQLFLEAQESIAEQRQGA